MSVRKIVTVPDPVLNKPCEKVRPGEDVRNLVQDLLDTLRASKNPEGAGLAAPQLGVLKRVCIARRFIKDPNKHNEIITKEVVLINPRIISLSEDTSIRYEGCLSIPDTYGQVERASKIKVIALDENMSEIKIKATGFFARIIQHEMDHLNGILFTSKVVGKTITEKDLEKLPDEEEDL